MTDQMVMVLQLIGSIMAVGIATTAVVWYMVVWPFDHRYGR